MKHHVIALGRQFGSGGREIGQKLAANLGIPCYDRELITLATERAQVSEELFAGKEEKAVNRWLYTAVYEGGPRVKRGQPAEDILFEMQSQVIRELAAKEDCIIVGRCGDFVLKNENVELLSMFICAPFRWRVHRRMVLEQISEKQAAAEIKKIDKQRKRYYDAYTKGDWGKPESYDLCVNSARLGVEKTASVLAVHYRELMRD